MSQSKTILITGGSRGIGLATAKLLNDGFNKLHLTASSMGSFKDSKIDNCEKYGLDLSKQENIHSFCEKIRSKTNHLDVLVNNMGIYNPGKFEESKEEAINNMIELNLKATILVTKELLPLIKKGENPQIIFISSMAAKTGIVGESVYAATKAGVSTFAEVLRNELRGKVRVTTIQPWGVNTFGSPDVDKFLRPEDIAEGIEFVITRDKNCSIDSMDFGNIHQWRGGEAPWSPKLD